MEQNISIIPKGRRKQDLETSVGGTCKYRNKCFKSNIKLLRIPTGNWWEAADQLAINKRGQGIETRDYRVTNPIGGLG